MAQFFAGIFFLLSLAFCCIGCGDDEYFLSVNTDNTQLRVSNSSSAEIFLEPAFASVSPGATISIQVYQKKSRSFPYTGSCASALKAEDFDWKVLENVGSIQSSSGNSSSVVFSSTNSEQALQIQAMRKSDSVLSKVSQIIVSRRPAANLGGFPLPSCGAD